jgi:hypothetical protein
MSADDPVRLSAGGSDAMRDLLRSSAADAPSPAQLASLSAKLAPMLHGGVASAAGGGATGVTTGVTTGLKAWLVVGTIAVAAVTGTIVVRRSRDHATPPTAAAPATTASGPAAAATGPATPASGPATPASGPATTTRALAAAAVASAPPPAVATVAPASRGENVGLAVAAAPGAGPSRPTSSPRRRSGSPAVAAMLPPPAASPSAPASLPSAPAAVSTEIQLLDAAQLALRGGDLARALALTSSHRDAYPRGAMTEEREAIAVEALVRLGRTDDARVRLASFVTRFPGSGYHARLQRLLSTAPR